MNALRNKVQLIGRLGRDPESFIFEDGKMKVNFPIATNETYKGVDGEKTERTQWHDVVVWGPLAEIVKQYLKKGSELTLEGRLLYRSYEDKEGATRYLTEIVMKEMLMLEKKPEVA
jgi:single-strand DNA-binding protein